MRDLGVLDILAFQDSNGCHYLWDSLCDERTIYPRVRTWYTDI